MERNKLAANGKTTLQVICSRLKRVSNSAKHNIFLWWTRQNDYKFSCYVNYILASDKQIKEKNVGAIFFNERMYQKFIIFRQNVDSFFRLNQITLKLSLRFFLGISFLYNNIDWILFHEFSKQKIQIFQ